MAARRFFYCCAGVLCLALSYQLGASGATAQGGGVLDTVRAREIILVGASGAPLVMILPVKGPDGLEHGYIKVGREVEPSPNPLLRFASWPLVEIDRMDDGGGCVTTYDDQGSRTARMSTQSGRFGALRTYDGSTKTAHAVLAATPGGGQLLTLGAEGDPIVELSATTDGEGMISTFDGSAGGQRLVSLGVAKGGEWTGIDLRPTRWDPAPTWL